MMIAYKLFRLKKDGGLGTLFIDKNCDLPLNKWLTSRPVKTKGYAFRLGWHCCEQKLAPHLSTNGRVWAKVEIVGVTKYIRPVSQGGLWFTANKMRILEVYYN
jgi:hypothetical protein